MNYKLQLNDPLWYDKRESIKLRDLNKCRKCTGTYKLAVHHTYYQSNLKAWEYPDSAYITLCEVCHSTTHSTEKIPFVRLHKIPKLKDKVLDANELVTEITLKLVKLIKTNLTMYPNLFKFSNGFLTANTINKKDKDYKLNLQLQNTVLTVQSEHRLKVIKNLKQVEKEIHQLLT